MHKNNEQLTSNYLRGNQQTAMTKPSSSLQCTKAAEALVLPNIEHFCFGSVWPK